MIFINGREVAQHYRNETKKAVSKLSAPPTLAVVLVGENPASQTYVKAKTLACKEAGILTRDVFLLHDSRLDELLSVIKNLNQDQGVDAILVQLPLPPSFDVEAVVHCISPEKDVDGFHPLNLGLLFRGIPRIVPCTPLGIMKLFEWYEIDLAGKEVVILNRSLLVGKPLALLCAEKSAKRNATVTLCHRATKNISSHIQKADILVVATGEPESVTGDMVKTGSVIIDVGINRVMEEGKNVLRGDVAESVKKKAGYLTPVPGGVGPMTIAMLLHNTLLCAQRRNLS